MWDRQMAALTPHFRVIRYDLRGHGASPVPPAPYDIADLGADVLALLDELGVDRAHVGGLSIGGLVGMWIAANAPERVDRLVLCCTSAAVRTAGGVGRARRHGPRRRHRRRRRRRRRALVHARVRRRVPGPRARDARHDRRHARRGVRRVLRRRRADGSPPEPDVDRGSDPRDRRRRRPGRPARAVRAHRGRDPRARDSPWSPHAAHLANVERPDEVNALILEHLLGEPTEAAPTKEAP